MKELTIKEKAQRYDEAIERACKIKNGEPIDIPDGTPIPVAIFPELAESEDEKIWIINYLSNRILNSTIIAEKENLKKAIAWLEKQGKQTPANKVEPKFKVGDVVTNKKSKDTVKIVQILHDSYCYSGWDGAATVHSDFSISEQDGWELVEQKPAWSKEDSPYYDDICEILINLLRSETANVNKTAVQKDLDWLKSLRPQSTWKPSEEQIEALEFVIKPLDEMLHSIGHIDNVTKPRLKEILVALKKLREE